jgi:hypothetical protein
MDVYPGGRFVPFLFAEQNISVVLDILRFSQDDNTPSNSDKKNPSTFLLRDFFKKAKTVCHSERSEKPHYCYRDSSLRSE